VLLAWTVVPAAAGARDVELKWVPGAGAASAGYLVYLSTVSGVYQEGTDIGPRSPAGDGIVAYTLQNVPDHEDVYVRLTAYSEDGIESEPSNEVPFSVTVFPPPDPDSVVVHVSEGSANPLLDASEGRLMDIAGLGLVYVSSMDPRGRIEGSGVADLSGDGAFETAFGISGRVRGKDTEIDRKLTLRIRSGLGVEKTNLTALLRRRIDSWYGNDEEDVRLRGKWDGDPMEKQLVNAGAVDPESMAWRVTFRIDEQAESNRKPVVGSVLYGKGKSIPLAGSARYSETTGAWSVRLKSSGDLRGVKMRFRDLVLAGVEPESGTLAYKAFGQKGRMELPNPF